MKTDEGSKYEYNRYCDPGPFHSYLSRMFRDKMNMTFSELLMSIRMKKAADLLKNTGSSIADKCI
jgi:YesN/AraC family two-component response regulator